MLPVLAVDRTTPTSPSTSNSPLHHQHVPSTPSHIPLQIPLHHHHKCLPYQPSKTTACVDSTGAARVSAGAGVDGLCQLPACGVRLLQSTARRLHQWPGCWQSVCARHQHISSRADTAWGHGSDRRPVAGCQLHNAAGRRQLDNHHSSPQWQQRNSHQHTVQALDISPYLQDSTGKIVQSPHGMAWHMHAGC